MEVCLVCGIYTADPEKDPTATKFKDITYDEIYTKGLPIIVVYPELTTKAGIHTPSGFTTKVKNLWNKLPVFRDNKYKVPVLHVPYNKVLIRKALDDSDFRVATKTTADDYFYK